METHGRPLVSALAPGKLVALENGNAVVRYAAQHATFVKMLDRNGKKELVREGLSQILGQPTGVTFEVDPEDDAPPTRTELPKPSATTTPEERIDFAPPRLTAELSEEIQRSDPLVKALMETLGATIVKVE